MVDKTIVTGDYFMVYKPTYSFKKPLTIVLSTIDHCKPLIVNGISWFINLGGPSCTFSTRSDFSIAEMQDTAEILLQIVGRRGMGSFLRRASAEGTKGRRLGKSP